MTGRAYRSKFAPGIMVAVLASAPVPRAALAQGNYRSTPIGGRSALMGNTGVALGRDGAAPFLNPATIVRINDHRLAFSVNFYSFNNVSLKNWHQPGSVDAGQFGNLAIGDTNLSKSSFNALPSTLCVFLTVAGFDDEEGAAANDKTIGAERQRGRQKLAACVATVERQEFSFTADSFRATSGGTVANQAQSLLRSWNRLVVGPTYAVDVTEHVSLGASLHGVATTYSNIWSTSSVTSDQTRAISSSFNKGMRGVSIDLGLIVGAAYRVSGNTLGLAFHMPTLHVLGMGSSTYHTQFAGAGEGASFGAASGGFAAPSPPSVSFGYGREVSWGVFEASIGYAFPMLDGIQSHLTGTEATVTGGVAAEKAVDIEVRERFRGAFNAALGTEYFINPSFSMLAGVSADFTAIPELTATGTSLATFTQARSTRVAASIGLGTHSAGNDLIIGTELNRGWGQSFAVNPYQVPTGFSVVDQATFGVLLVIAGTTSLRAINKVIDNVQHLVAPKPGPILPP